MNVVWIICGVAILLVGGELLVRHASKLALTAGLSPLVVGLTIVAFGTSAPELMTTIYGQISGESALAIGNAVGSNIINVFLILGLSALVAPLTVDSQLARAEIPAVLVVSLAVSGFAYSGTISPWESLVLLAALAGTTAWSIIRTRGSTPETADVSDEVSELVPSSSPHWSLSAGLVVVGLVLVVAGGRFFVSGAAELARNLGVGEAVIGLTIVAGGTSLPELVTSVLASLRGHREIAVGNVVGSNLFNLTAAVGLAGLVGFRGLPVPSQLLVLDLPVMVASAVVCLPVMTSGGQIDRWEGAIFVIYYLAYVTYLILQATGHVALVGVGRTILWGVVPLTLVTIGVIVHRSG